MSFFPSSVLEGIIAKNFKLKISGYNQCNTCKQIKPLNEFNTMKKFPQYYYNDCKVCRPNITKAKAHEHYITTKQNKQLLTSFFT